MTKRPHPQDAFKYGVDSSHIVLPWESEDEFKELHRNLQGEFYPDGPMEEETVYEIARWQWVKRRLTIGAQGMFRGPDNAALREATKDTGWEGLFEHLHKNRSLQPMIRQLDQIVRAQGDLVVGNLSFVNNRVRSFSDRVEARDENRKKRKDQLSEPTLAGSSGPQLADDKQKLVHELLQSVSRMQRDTEEEPDDEIDEFRSLLTAYDNNVGLQQDLISAAANLLNRMKEFDEWQTWFKSGTRPDLVDEILKSETEINKQIDKLFMRLNQLKGYKKSWTRKRVRSPAPQS